MPGMPPMDYKANTRMRKGRYIGTMSLPLPGSWNIAVKIKRDGKNLVTHFTVDVE
jgi:hypothetical protein